MIRRLLLFVALLGVGFALLWLALGSSAFAPRRTGAGTTPRPAPSQSPPRGIDVRPPQGTGSVTFSIQGEFSVQPTREVALPDGSRLLLPKYRLHAADTRPRPEADNLMELRDVTVELYRVVRPDPASGRSEPAAEQTALLTAHTVLVEIERDERGRPTIHEDREMEFRDAHFRTLASAGATPIELRVARARLRTTEAGSRLRTEPDEPFTLLLHGSEPATVTGKGLDATMPGDEATGPVEVHVLAEPRLVSADGRTDLSARGTLSFTEQPDQTGLLVLREAVTVL